MNGWLIALAIVGGLILLLILVIFLGSARVRLSVDGSVTVTVSVLGIRKTLYPRRAEKKRELMDVSGCKHPEKVLRREEKRRRKAAAKAEQKRLKREEKRAKKEAERKKGAAPAPNLKENLDMILALIKRAHALTRGKIVIEFRKFHLYVATGDAAGTAILYGVILQTAAYLLQFTEDHFAHVRRRDGDMTVEADYLAPHPSAEVDLRLSVRLFRAVRIGFGMLRAYLTERRRARRRAAKRVAAKKADRPANIV